MLLFGHNVDHDCCSVICPSRRVSSLSGDQGHVLPGLSRDKSDDWGLAFVDANGFRVSSPKCHDQTENGTLKAVLTCTLVVVSAERPVPLLANKRSLA
jgi:hypothetical protein